MEAAQLPNVTHGNMVLNQMFMLQAVQNSELVLYLLTLFKSQIIGTILVSAQIFNNLNIAPFVHQAQTIYE